MRIGKLWLATGLGALLGALPAVANAQPGVSVNVGVNIGDSYDTAAPGDPVENVDVFYDQLSPYGMWVDEPDVGRVFVPEETNYVPYVNGHWQYTSVGFVWVSSERFAWATTHYGRWAYSNAYGRWYWLPDTQWGPAWVEWRQTGSDFGWAPLPPEIVVRRGWQPPAENWHYCPAERVLDVNVTRYYEPRERVVVIHRDARPIEHYSTISNVKVVVGPPAAVLREHRVEARPVKVDARVVGRWSPAEAHAQVARAQVNKATFEQQNEKRIDANVKIREAHTKVIETHPAIKAQVTARAVVKVEPKRPEPARPETRVEPKRPEPVRPAPARPETRIESKRPEPVRPATPAHPEPKRVEPAPARSEPVKAAPERKAPERKAPAPKAPEPRAAAPERVQPAPKAPAPERKAEPRQAPAQPERKAEPRPAQPERAQPAPKAPPAERRAEPQRKEPDRKEPDGK